MPIERTFLGWDRPLLASAVEALERAYGEGGRLDLSGVVVVTPGARAGRRLIELLVERADADGLDLLPPRTVTPAPLAELLYETQREAAGDLTRALAWAEALRAEREAAERLATRLPADDDLAGWAALGEMFDRMHAELAGEGLTFADVAERCGSMEDFDDADRWLAADRVREAYLARLGSLNLADVRAARLDALGRGAVRAERDIVLVGVAELGEVVARMLEAVADRVRAWVFAPGSLADRFDALGRLDVSAWLEAELDVPESRVRIVDRPADQAAAVVESIAELGGQYRAEQITVGVPDERLVPYLEQQLRRAAVPARHAAGMPVSHTGPYRLLTAVADYLSQGRRFADFAALVRHPDVERYLAGPPGESGGDATRAAVEGWAHLLDRYYNDTLHGRLTGEWLGDARRAEPLRRVHGRVEALLGDLGGQRPLHAWAEAILKVLAAVYGGRPLDRRRPADRPVILACEALHDALAQQHAIDPALAGEVSASTAIRLAQRQAQGAAVPPEPVEGAVELLGWLELAADDAPALVVTGFNEGLVPASVNADPFLPNALRRHLATRGADGRPLARRLGLSDNDRRYARDAYALSAILASRGRVTLIAGRRSPELDPLTPSRLLLRGDRATLAARVRRYFGPADTPSRRVAAGAPGRAESAFAVPPIDPPSPPLSSMRVTAFADYLKCPYRFCLRHVLGLEPIDDRAEELTPGQFGELIHDVLKAFGSDPEAAACADADALERRLSAMLDALARERFGRDRLPAVTVQIEQARRRLAGFARWQADWYAQGWRVVETELPFREQDAWIEVDGEPMYLRGRIDRLDRHEKTGEWAVIDYKTGERPLEPDKAHRNTGGEWTDLQLPLYRHLLRSRGIGSARLGYVLLPRVIDDTRAAWASWDDADLADADARAAEVVRNVRRGAFWPPTAPYAGGFDDFAALCHAGHIGALSDPEEADDDE